jgi:competence protein ComEA
MFAITKLLNSASTGIARRPLRVIVLLGVALAASGTAAGWLATRPAQAVHRAAPPPDAGEPALALVFVSGAVVHPGLYHLSPDARIADAIAAAGGLGAEADTGRLPNLAARVHEGKQVNVPSRRSASGRSVAAKLDLNTATVEELRAVPTMPVGLAEAIAAYREQFGPFRSLSDLRTMLGLDGPTVTGLRPYMRVAPVPP